MDEAIEDSIATQAATAIAEQKWGRLRYIGNRFERARRYREAWSVLAQSVEATSDHAYPIWPGPTPPQPNTTGVLVLPRSRDLGDELRILRFIGSLQQHVNTVYALVEPRLAPLLERSFPGLICRDPSQPSVLKDITHMAAQERLAFWFGANSSQLVETFKPLIPPAQATSEPAKGIGISWFSKSRNKTLPAIEDWVDVLKRIRRPLQSLQYLEKPAKIRALRELSGRRIRSAQPIDQMTDIDGFAGQIKGMQGVLTISNTTAHLAGALGVPCVVILDNGTITNWPNDGDCTPLYPHTRLIRRGDDDWSTTLQRGWRTLKAMVQDP